MRRCMTNPIILAWTKTDQIDWMLTDSMISAFHPAKTELLF